MRIEGLVRRLAGAATAGVCVGVAVFAGCWALAWVSLSAPSPRSAGAIRDAYAARDLRPEAIWRFGDTDIGAHQFNDCLVLGQALDVRAPRGMLAVSPLSTVEAPGGPCLRLAQLASASPPAPGTFYHHYVHAGTTLTRLLLPAFGVRGLREFYRLTSSLILIAGIAFALIDLARRRRATATAWLVIFVALARWFGLETFGQSLGHAPADIVAIAFLLWLSRASATEPLSACAAITGAGAFGGLTMAFELLTGGLPLGLAITLGALPLTLADDENADATTLRAGVAFCAAAASCLLAKVAAVIMVWGVAPIATAARELLFLAGVRPVDLSGGNPRVGPGAYLLHLWAGLDSLAPGLIWLTTGTLALAIAGGIWACVRLRGEPFAGARRRATWLMGSNLVLVAWLLALWQHSAVHAWFMARILVWTIASGGAAFVLAVSRLHSDDRAAPVPAFDGTDR